MSEKIKKWYAQGLWTAAMVEQAVTKGVLTAAEAADITGGGETAVPEGGDGHGPDIQPES